MLPTQPFLLSRPLCGTLRRAQCTPAAAVNRAKTKPYFTPNSHRVSHGNTHRPLANFPHVFIPTPLPCLAPTAACNCAPLPVVPERKVPHHWKSISVYWLKISVSGFALALTFLAAPVIYCEPVPSSKGTTTPSFVTSPSQSQKAAAPPAPPPLPPQSSVNFYELTFGTVCGVCAGVFVKKGARMVAFTLGGVFVLLQYLGSMSLVRVDWGRAASRFENLFYRKDALGVSRPPNVGSLFRWIIDFLTADFQPRATFVAGFVLGLRVG